MIFRYINFRNVNFDEKANRIFVIDHFLKIYYDLSIGSKKN